MYEASFHFTHRPFSPLPRTDRYFPGEASESARLTLTRCIERGEGVGLIIGPSGTGKSLLCQVLAEQFRGRFKTVMLSKTRGSTRRTVLQAILYEVKQPYRGMDEGELRLSLIDYFTLNDECREGVVLLVDEAHRLPLRLLDEIGMLANLAVDGQPRVRLVLTGLAELEERLASPKLQSLAQRIVARSYLETLGRGETQQYIHAQLEAVGGDAERVFPAETCAAIQKAADGVPRLINQLCDHSLLLAYSNGQQEVDVGGVEEAWTDLQQLPTPWASEKPAHRDEQTIIEFGGLDDEPADSGMERVPVRSQLPTIPRFRVTSEEDDVDDESLEATSLDAMSEESLALESMPEGTVSLDASSEDSTSMEAITLDASPLDQLSRIEEAIDELDEEFEPAGSIGPEVELIFNDPGNPFSEPFAEEEVVVDAAAARANPGKDPVWHAAETRRASTGGNLPPAWQGTVPSTSSSATPTVEQGWNSPAITPNETIFGASGDVTTCGAPVFSTGDPTAAPIAGDAGGTTSWSTVPMRRDSTAELSVTADDSDMIVIEEGYEPTDPLPVRAVTPVRPQEYRRLFARLRHG